MEVNFDRNGIKNQIKESYGKVVYSHTCHIKCAKRIKRKSDIIKLIIVILSAISTCGLIGVIIDWNPKIVAIISVIFTTIDLVLSTYSKAAKLDDDVIAHKDSANKLWLLREKYISLLTDFDYLSNAEIRKYRDKYTLELSYIYDNELFTDNKSYKEAQKALKCEDEQFFSCEELNKILPEHLRTMNKI